MKDEATFRFRRFTQSVAAFLIAVVVALQFGCAMGPAVPDTRHQSGLGKVAIIATSQEPLIQFEGFGHSKFEGAAAGAGRTFLECLSALGGGGCSGDFCGAVAILWAGVCGVSSTVGGLFGAAAAPGEDELPFSEDVLATVLSAETIQSALRYQTDAAAIAGGADVLSALSENMHDAAQQGDYRPLANAGVDTLLEIGLTEVSTVGKSIKAPLLLRMQARVRLIRVGDSSEIFSADYIYMGERLKLGEWSENRSERLLAGLQTGYETLGAHIFENVFQLYPFPDRHPHSSGFLSTSFGLAPIFPRTRGQLTGDPMIGVPIAGAGLMWSTVDSLRPTLRWQSFPRAADIKAASEVMGRINDVRYDLVIAQEQNFAPAQIVYQRAGLTDSSHTVDVSLNPATRYFWTVRARFELDKHERVTEWASTHFKVREQWTAPSLTSYRFKTPK